MGNRNFEFSWEFKDFCIRTMHETFQDRTTPIRKNCPIELVKYMDHTHKSCYVVAWFKLEGEGYALHFVGDRPMNDITADEMKSIWPQLQAAQKMLNAYFEACEEAEWNE